MTKFDQYTQDSRKILVITSQPLDLDCIASGLVIKKYLQHINKDAVLIFPRELSPEEAEQYNFLPYFEEFNAKDSREYLARGDFDTLILLDGTNWVQFYDYKNEELPAPVLDKSKKIIQIDHHLGDPEDLATYQIKNNKASSTVEVILSEITLNNFIDESIATLSYAGLVGDTGNFRWNFRAAAMKTAAMLLEEGARTTELLERTFFSKSRGYLDMLSYAIKNTEYDDELQTQFLFMPLEKQQRDGISEEMLKLLGDAYTSELANTVKGYPRGLYIKEFEEKGKIKISGRGSSMFNKINLPILFFKLGGNGGGHFNAAGTSCTRDLEEVKKELKDALREMLKEV